MSQDNEETRDNGGDFLDNEISTRPFSLTLEVPLFLIMFSGSIAGASVSNILLYRTCVHTLDRDEQECRVFLSPEHSNGTQALEEEVQKYATFVWTVKLVMESIVPAVLALFLGVWSDTYGRKPLIVWPLFGYALSSILVVVYSTLDQFGPWWFVLAGIPAALTGGFTSLFTGAFCYLSDITSSSSRTIRMTILEGSLSVGSIVGALLSSYLLKALGNVNVQLLSAALVVLAYAFTNVYLVESLRGAIKGSIFTLMDFLLVKEMCRECFKRRPNNGRAQILLLVLVNSLFLFVGMNNLDYMYTRKKLDWSLKDYNFYVAVATFITLIGSVIGVMFLQKVCHISDLVLTIVAFINYAVKNGIKAFATQTWHMYLGAGITLFRTLSSPLIRSHLTKTLPVEDIAKVFALMCAIEALCPLISPPLFNFIYVSTIGTFPGAMYLVTLGISLLCIAMIGMVIFYRCRATIPYEPAVNS